MAEYNTHVSQKGFNPLMEQSKFNPPAPVNDSSANYQRKVAEANQIMSIATSFGKSFGLAHQREQEQEEMNALAENKIFREELIQAEIQGRAYASTGKDLNETIAKKILRDSNKFRRSNPELVARLNRGYQLKTGELTVSQRNSDLKVNAPDVIEQLGFEWIKQRQDAILGQGKAVGADNIPEGYSVPDFPDFVSEFIDNDALEAKGSLIGKNPLIAEVLAKEGKRLNYDPYYDSAAKWYKEYKGREKQKAINNVLSKQSWSEINNLQGVRDILKKEFNLDRQRANKETVGFLIGHFQNRVINEGESILNDPIFRQIPLLLSQPDEHGVSLLTAKGKYSIGAEAKELLTLVNATHKRLYDKAELLKNNSSAKADKEREKGLQLQFSVVFAGIQESLSNAKTLGDIIEIRGQAQEIIKTPFDKNITIYNTLGGDSPVDLMKLIRSREKEIQTETDKPKEQRKLTPEELEIKNDAIVKFGQITNNIKIIENFELTQASVEKVNSLLQEVKHIYSSAINGTNPRNALKNDWQTFPEFYSTYNKALTDINTQKTALEGRIEKANEKENVKTQTYNNYKRHNKNEARNAITKATIISSFHERLEQFLKLPTEERLDFNLDILETALDKQVNKFRIKDEGLLLIGDQPKDKVPLFSESEINMYLSKIADTRETHQREIDAKTNVSPVETDPDLYETINQEIDALVNVPALQLYNERDKTEGRITKIKGKISKKYRAKELTTTDYNHIWVILNKLSSDADKTLNGVYGSKTVFDEADKMLKLSIAGSSADGINTILSTSQGILLKSTTGDLKRFQNSMVERWPNIFSNTNHENHPLREGIYSAYVEWLEGKEKTEDILKKYLTVREFAGEKKARFTEYEERVFRDSIPKNKSPHEQAFADLAIRIATRTGTPLPITPEKKGTEVKSSKSLTKLIEKAAEKGVVLSPKQIEAARSGTIYIFEEAGDHVWEIVEVDNSSEITDDDIENTLFKNN